MRRPRASWLALLLLALLVACGQPAPPERPVVVRDETRVLNAAERGALSEVQEDGTLLFSGALATPSRARAAT